MWYEILPCAGIITAAMAGHVVVNYQLMKWWQYGNPYKRDISAPLNETLYFRDVRLTGSTYISKGLDNIPDN